MPARYLRSKVLTPTLHADSVVRHRLVDRLATSGAQVWLLSAPAGYGKTTAVAQAIEASSDDIAWLSIDGADNDPVRFWTHLAAAVLGHGPELDELAEGIDADNLDATADEILSFIERQSAAMILVLDDLHEVTDIDTLEILGRIVSGLPANLRVAITSRADPALPIARLRAQGDLVEIRAPDLAFTVAEAGAVFGGLELETLEGIVERTEGWATALRLLAVSISGSTLPAQTLETLGKDRSEIADFLSAEALGSLRPDLQSFLITTSIVDELAPDLADSLTGDPGGLATLRELARSQVFTDLVDPATNTYRYHRLFREFLRQRAQELNPETLTDLHQRAADWHSQHDNPTATIEHAMAAGNHEMALQVIKTFFSVYGQAGRMATANSWLETYGLDRCYDDPELRLMAAWVLLNIRRYDSVERWLEPRNDEEATPSELAQTHAIRSHLARHRGNLKLALHEGANAVAIVPDDDPLDLDWSFAFGVLTMAQVIAGGADFATACSAATRGRSSANNSSVVTGYSGLAAVTALERKTDEAEAYADQALAFVSSPTLERFHQPVTALLVKSQIAMTRGQVGDAAGYAERAERIAIAGVEPLLAVMARCQLARVTHAQGHPEQARQWLRDAEALLVDGDAAQLVELIRQTRNDTRFAHRDESLPVELSEREQAVLHLLPHGLSRKELGAQLFISENTVKTYLTSLRHKLGVTGRSSEIVARAVELGLLDSVGDFDSLE
jgi:LuxR family maltose regulon positive regulatory protein